MSGAAVRIEGLVKRYDGAAVLSIPGMEFASARIHVVVGPNGAGKTTLLRLLNGIEAPDEGRLVALDHPLPPPSSREGLELRRRISFAAQKPCLFGTTVRRNVEYPLRVRGVDRAECARRAGIAMERLGIVSLADRPARGLSAGETQRVSLARALVPAPDLLLLDEPLAHIDPGSVPLLEALLRELPGRGTTVIVATHALEQAYRLSADVTRLEGGRPAPPAIENLLEGDLAADGDGAVLTLPGGGRIAVVSDRRGRVRASISPDDIVVSTAPFESSAGNALPGRVTGLVQRGGQVRVTFESTVPLVAHVTPESCRRLGLTAGTEVTLTFQASAVRIF